MMSYADSVLERISALRESRLGMISEGRTTQAEHLQRQIITLYNRYVALTGDVD
jgi:hypothetical protein